MLLQVFPVQGIYYLLGKSFFQSELNSKLFCDQSNEEDSDGEDSIKFKKQEYLHDSDSNLNHYWNEMSLKSPVKLKIGQTSDHFCEILIPPPNASI